MCIAPSVFPFHHVYADSGYVGLDYGPATMVNAGVAGGGVIPWRRGGCDTRATAVKMTSRNNDLRKTNYVPVSVHLLLRPINQLYDHYSVSTGPNVAGDGTFLPVVNPLTVANPVPTTATPVGTNVERTRFQNQSMSRTKQAPYFLFVHGWRMKNWERQAFAEASFKRMFWSNYKGQFGMFDWPTQWTANPPSDPGNFDRSEFVAWNSAPGLINAIAGIRENAKPTGGSLNLSVMAHSMGAVVLSEALYQTQNAASPLVDTAIMSQGAVSSHYFSPRTDLLKSLKYPGQGVFTDVVEHTSPSWTEYLGFSPVIYPSDPSVPPPPNLDVIGGITPRFRSIAASAGKLLNYYNPKDYALLKWEIDQKAKPTGMVNEALYMGDWGFSGNNYGYYPPSLGNNFYRYNRATPAITALTFAANPYELFAFCAASRVAAIGRVENMAGLGGVFVGDKNLSRGFGASFDDKQPGHSAQFVHSYLMVGKYWRQLVGDIK